MTSADMLLRLFFAALSGLALGIERESHGRAAGLRTTVLVCIAPCLGMILSTLYYGDTFLNGSTWHPDPVRLAAGMVTGIGFIGAGVIIKHNNMVRGVTTAAVLWVATLLGLAYGAGQLLLGLAGLAFAELTLAALPLMERFIRNDWYSDLTITSRNRLLTAEKAAEILEPHRIRVKNVRVDYDAATKTETLSLYLKYKKRDLLPLPQQIRDEFMRQDGVIRFKWD